ncbi:hypothetical protein HanPI659440_Chr05g0209351 [Helianthus annuus]|nr:hypothetical protein HanPI659440_Chr05g0209351 [Helianthus annuus]
MPRMPKTLLKNDCSLMPRMKIVMECGHMETTKETKFGVQREWVKRV